MKKTMGRKVEYIVVAFILLLFILISFLSINSIWTLQANTGVASRVGYLNGAAQRLVKCELQGEKNDDLIASLDTTINELLTAENAGHATILADSSFMGNLKQVKILWEQIKPEIGRVRKNDDGRQLYKLSEDFFTLIRQTVESAHQYTENQLVRSTWMLMGVIVLFLIILVISLVAFLRSLKLRKRADALNKIAYFDPLTKLPNRVSSERQIAALLADPPAKDLVVFMFDMNNLKIVNNSLGRKFGDKLIAEFGKILNTEAKEYGFVGRFGGDEFIAIFLDANENMVGRYLSSVNEKIVGYNLLCVSGEEQISFSVGYCIDNMKTRSLEDIITEAETRMYVKKREVKGLQ